MTRAARIRRWWDDRRPTSETVGCAAAALLALSVITLLWHFGDWGWVRP